MKLKQSINLLLIALFVWAFESSAIHLKHHTIDEISECKVCSIAEKIDLYQHNSPAISVSENIAVQIRRKVEKLVIKSKFNYTEVVQLKQATIVENRHYVVQDIPLGFNATAPPKYFS